MEKCSVGRLPAPVSEKEKRAVAVSLCLCVFLLNGLCLPLYFPLSSLVCASVFVSGLWLEQLDTVECLQPDV